MGLCNSIVAKMCCWCPECEEDTAGECFGDVENCRDRRI